MHLCKHNKNISYKPLPVTPAKTWGNVRQDPGSQVTSHAWYFSVQLLKFVTEMKATDIKCNIISHIWFLLMPLLMRQWQQERLETIFRLNCWCSRFRFDHLFPLLLCVPILHPVAQLSFFPSLTCSIHDLPAWLFHPQAFPASIRFILDPFQPWVVPAFLCSEFHLAPWALSLLWLGPTFDSRSYQYFHFQVFFFTTHSDLCHSLYSDQPVPHCSATHFTISLWASWPMSLF